MKGDPLATFANARKSFWLTQGLEPATVWFPLNRLTSVPKTTYNELCGLIFFKKKPSHCSSRTLFSKDKYFDFDFAVHLRDNVIKTTLESRAKMGQLHQLDDIKVHFSS